MSLNLFKPERIFNADIALRLGKEKNQLLCQKRKTFESKKK